MLIVAAVVVGYQKNAAGAAVRQRTPYNLAQTKAGKTPVNVSLNSPESKNRNRSGNPTRQAGQGSAGTSLLLQQAFENQRER